MILVVNVFTWASQLASWAVVFHLYKAGRNNESPSSKFIERCAIAAFVALIIASVTLSIIASQCAMYDIPI